MRMYVNGRKVFGSWRQLLRFQILEIITKNWIPEEYKKQNARSENRTAMLGDRTVLVDEKDQVVLKPGVIDRIIERLLRLTNNNNDFYLRNYLRKIATSVVDFYRIDEGRQGKFSKERMERWEAMAKTSRRNKQEGGGQW